MKKKVFVGISGGVDSSVAAYLLKQQGYDVIGVFMKNWSGEDFGVTDNCPWKEDQEMSKNACKTLEIPFKTYNFEKEYRKEVIDDFYYQYSIGNTPNPDVLCNKYIKFDAFLKLALSQGADLIATGHYSKTESGRLYKARDKNKDQTYFLHQLNSEQLSKSLFPLSDLLKSEVRDIAKKIKLPNAKRKDSQGICFIGKVDIREFLKEKLKEKKGDIIDIDTNEIVGTHSGVWFLTIGQRKGIGTSGNEIPYFVAKKDVRKNIVYVAKGHDNPKLFGRTIEIENAHKITKTGFPKDVDILIRYRGNYEKAELKEDNNVVTLLFKTPVWAPAIGQSAVIFKENECLGGGPIAKIVI
ncbi:tRNA 2-thiouridine(34) synthase MnmA [Candidatus Dojkabacteria bacterium]|jgi:tRNA-specific 2-thiouridylase|nr:tRNA 2-thiouridine(34) synthase MnmA [Candidatus Dojkabacteria bacterium]